MKKEIFKALDLFCGAGGASTGLADAGFDVTGVDINPQPSYPFKFIQKDATKLSLKFLKRFDFIWASPPCQLFTQAKHLMKAQGHKTSALNLIPQTRILLTKSKKLFVMENVPGAPLSKDLMLCGSSFGLGVRRHRIFECNFYIYQPLCQHKKQGRPWGVYYIPNDNIPCGGRTARNVEHGREVMGINYMSWNELKESIPPKYGEHIGKFAIKHINEVKKNAIKTKRIIK